jgi:hypothetical protein
MIVRHFVFALVMCAGWAFVAAAAEGPAYAVSGKAERTGDKVTVDVKVSRKVAGGELVDGRRVVETAQSARFKLFEGKRASMVANLAGGRQAAKPAAEAKPVASLDEVDSGLRVDVISVKGVDKLLVTASVIEDGVTVWAEAKMLDVTVKAAEK